MGLMGFEEAGSTLYYIIKRALTGVPSLSLIFVPDGVTQSQQRVIHSLLLVVALAIPVLLGWRARGWDDLKTLLIMDAYVLLIHPINLWLGTNYGYTQGPPIPGTLLDYLGTAPWYYLWAQLPVLALLRLLMLPVHDRSED